MSTSWIEWKRQKTDNFFGGKTKNNVKPSTTLSPSYLVQNFLPFKKKRRQLRVFSHTPRSLSGFSTSQTLNQMYTLVLSVPVRLTVAHFCIFVGACSGVLPVFEAGLFLFSTEHILQKLGYLLFCRFCTYDGGGERYTLTWKRMTSLRYCFTYRRIEGTVEERPGHWSMYDEYILYLYIYKCYI